MVVDMHMFNQRVLPVCMEPRACSAAWDEKTQKMVMYGDTQIPHTMRNQIAERLKLQPDQIHLMTGPRGRRLRRQRCRCTRRTPSCRCWPAGSSGR